MAAVDSALYSIAPEQRARRAAARQRELERVIVEPFASTKQLWLAVRSYLVLCSDAEALRSSQQQLWQCVRLSSDQSEIFVGDKSNSAKNFNRDRSRPHLERSDGAWFDFAFLLGTTPDGVAVRGYNAEIRFGANVTVTQARWIRFDLNPEGHSNDDERSMRAHVHAGCDDWLMPSPAFRPFELLDLLVFGLASDSGRTPRDATTP